MEIVKPKVDVIIVNWNAGEQLYECLVSIEKFGVYDVDRVVVVDNASYDRSCESVEQEWPFSFQVIRNATNRGFAAACNQGAALGRAPFVLFLNPDARLYERSLPSTLAAFESETYKDVGIIGVQLVTNNGAIARSCGRFPTIGRFVVEMLGIDKLSGSRWTGVHMDDWDHRSTQRVDHVIGAFFCARRNVFEVLGGFDERFVVYLEDMDFSLRAKMAGWNSLYLSDVQAFHAGGGTSRRVKGIRLYYALRSRLSYALKHFSVTSAVVYMILLVTLAPLARLGYCAVCGDLSGMRYTIEGYYLLVKALPKIVKGSARPIY